MKSRSEIAWPNNWRFSLCSGAGCEGGCDLFEGFPPIRACMVCEWLWPTARACREVGTDNVRKILNMCVTDGFRQAFKEFYLILLTSEEEGGD